MNCLPRSVSGVLEHLARTDPDFREGVIAAYEKNYGFPPPPEFMDSIANSSPWPLDIPDLPSRSARAADKIRRDVPRGTNFHAPEREDDHG